MQTPASMLEGVQDTETHTFLCEPKLSCTPRHGKADIWDAPVPDEPPRGMLEPTEVRSPDQGDWISKRYADQPSACQPRPRIDILRPRPSSFPAPRGPQTSACGEHPR